MPDFGDHAIFIWGAYAATLAIALGLIAWVLLDGRRQRHLIAELEARGVRRRSVADGEPAGRDRGKR